MISVARMSLLALPLLTVVLQPTTLLAQEQEDSQSRGEVGTHVRTIEVTVLGMTCSFCAYGVEQKLNKLEGVGELTVDLKNGRAILEMDDEADVSNETLLQTVDAAGFDVSRIIRNFESEFPDYTADEGLDPREGENG